MALHNSAEYLSDSMRNGCKCMRKIDAMVANVAAPTPAEPGSLQIGIGTPQSCHEWFSYEGSKAVMQTGGIMKIECLGNVTGGCMADNKTVIEQAYSAFNKRDIDGALALMTPDVSWPKASEGGKVVGKDEIRAYWTRQWGEFDPHVEPLAMTEEDGGKIHVRVHQLVKSLQGKVLSESEVLHVFTVNNGLIDAMDLGDKADSTTGPSSAFAHRS